MTALMRRQPSGVDFTDWVGRLFDDRLFPDRHLWASAFSDLRVEEFTDDQTLVVRAEMPGIDPDKDVEISLHDGILHIKAERREKTEHTGKDEYRSEFRYGMFERTLPLPAGVSESDVQASYKDGILEIRLPKAKDAKATTIPVTRQA
jgi:HSP20 family protein